MAEAAQLTRLCDLADPRTEVILIVGSPPNKDVINYWNKILEVCGATGSNKLLKVGMGRKPTGSSKLPKGGMGRESHMHQLVDQHSKQTWMRMRVKPVL